MRLWLLLIFISLFNIIFILTPKQELQVIYHLPLLPYQQRLRLKLGSPFYEYVNFLKDHIPENSTVAIPSETPDWGMYGNFLYMQYWLYPRKITTDVTRADYSLYVQNRLGNIYPSDAQPTQLLQSNPLLGFIKQYNYD